MVFTAPVRTSFTLLTRVLQKYFHVVRNYFLLSPPCPPSLPPVPVQFSPAATSPRHVGSSLLTTALGARLQNDISVSPSWGQDTCVQRRGMIRSRPHAHPQGLKGQLSKLGKGGLISRPRDKTAAPTAGAGGQVHLLKDLPSPKGVGSPPQRLAIQRVATSQRPAPVAWAVHT